ncbi:MAG: cytochrome c biogenesis protein CcdA [Candidatus Omnitrophota bacterium]|jgi:thiol:disulfide interchange protein DsbD
MILQGDSLSYVGAFLGGVIVSFSPCVYPLVPITLGFIGIKGGSSRFKGFILSLAYVFGLAITYSILGLFASLTGTLFGRISSHPVSYLVIGNVCIIAALSFFDIIHLNFTGIRLQNKVNRRGDLLSALLLGMASGLVAGPCTLPALASILFYVASKQNLFYGASLLFVFAYGMGFLLILVGTFSGIFVNLLRGERLSANIKKISGFILLAIGEYFLIKAGRFM